MIIHHHTKFGLKIWLSGSGNIERTRSDTRAELQTDRQTGGRRTKWFQNTGGGGGKMLSTPATTLPDTQKKRFSTRKPRPDRVRQTDRHSDALTKSIHDFPGCPCGKQVFPSDQIGQPAWQVHGGPHSDVRQCRHQAVLTNKQQWQLRSCWWQCRHQAVLTNKQQWQFRSCWWQYYKPLQVTQTCLIHVGSGSLCCPGTLGI